MFSQWYKKCTLSCLILGIKLFFYCVSWKIVIMCEFHLKNMLTDEEVINNYEEKKIPRENSCRF